MAVQCQIEPEQIEKDCRMVAERLERLTISEDNHFTDYDIMCALKTYYVADEKAYRRRTEFISKKTGILLTPNKRNGRKQATHLKIARSTLAVMNEDRGEVLQGRPDKAKVVAEWQKKHPGGKKAECIRDTGLSKPTVYRWWKEI